MADDIVTQAIAGNWHSVKVVVPPDTSFTLQDEEFYKPMKNNDIVTLLRNACDSNNCWCPMGTERCLEMKAADEIEKLRGLLTMQVASVISNSHSLIRQIANNQLIEWAEKVKVITYD